MFGKAVALVPLAGPICEEGQVGMLRIHIQREAESTSLTIEGKLTGPWVMELEKCWREEMSREPTGRVVVNLAAVSFVDAGGRELLSRMRRQGARLIARGCLMKMLVDEIEVGLSEELTRDVVW
jgi:ABC-type transporter Mla MlaB component